MPPDLPTYTQRLSLPDGGAPAIAGVQPLQGDAFGEGAVGHAVAGAGTTALTLQQRFAAAQEHTKLANTTTDFLTKLDGLEQRQTENPDYQAAPGAFVDARITLEQEALSGIDNPMLRAQAGLQFRRAGLIAFKRVRDHAHASEADANVANLDAQEIPNLRDAAVAGSEAEREAATSRMRAAVDDAAAAGWITAQAAQQRMLRFAKYIDNRDVMETIRNDPGKALELLKDPKFAPALDPVTREQYVNNATAAQDDRAIGDLVNRARFKPEIASLELGRVVAPAHADAIFVNGIIPQESGGDAKAVSAKGALGISQIMPGTAREVATKLGMADIAGLDDAALKKRLLDDVPLNQRLGNTYWRMMLSRYEGSVPLALAAYNAGPGRADEWKAKAAEKYGASFTPAQLVDVIGIAETKNYVTQIYARIGAGVAGAGISPGAQFRAATAVGSEVQQQINAADQVARNLAAVAHATDDISKLYSAGYNVDPARETAYRQTQQHAADRGDLQALQRLRDLDEARGMAPFHRAAWGMPPLALDAAVSQLEADAARSGNVTTAQNRQLLAFRAVRDEIRNKRNTDPISLGEVAGAYRPVALDPGSAPDDPAFGAILRERGRQGDLAGRLYLGSSNALKPEEVKAFKERWANAGPNEQFGLLQAFGRNLPERAYVDTLKAVIGNDTIAETVGRVARTRPDLARDILQGQALMGTKEVSDKAAMVRPALAGKLAGQVYPDPAMQDAVVNAALALYTQRRGGAGALYDATDSDGIGKALEEITGPIVKRNGRRTPIAPGIAPRAFNEALDHLTDREVTMMGGAYGRNGTPIAAADIGDRAQLVPLAPGSPRYAVLMPTPDGRGAPVMTYDAGPLVFDMRQIVGSVQVPLTPYQQGRRADRAAAWERMRAAREASQP